MSKRPSWERARYDAAAELWDLLGRDPLGTRITGVLMRHDITTPDRLREAFTEPGPKEGGDAFGPGVDIDEIPGLGSAALARIRDRLANNADA